MSVDFDWSQLTRTAKKPLMLLGNPPRLGHLEATRVPTTASVKSELLKIVDIAIARLHSFGAVPYSETQALDEDEYFVGTLSEALGLPVASDVDDEGGVRESTEFDTSAALVAAVKSARETGKKLSLSEIESGTFVFYIVVISDIEGKDIAFVRKTTGLKVVTRNRFYMRFAEQLAKLDDPIFKIDLFFDFVVRGNDVAIWNVDNFMALFADVDALKRAVPAFVQVLNDALAVTLSNATITLLEEAGKNSVRLAQQIRRLSRLTYLKQVDEAHLRDYLAEVESLNLGISVDDETIDVPIEGIPGFLHLVEQRLWKGPFDGAVRQAQSFAKLTP